MKVTTVIVLLLLHYNRCLTIRVPVDWTQDSEVNKSEQIVNTDENEEATQKPIYKDYFQYTAQKPQFAVDVAVAHDVQSPENLYKAHPVRPYTNLVKPVLGQHHILDSNRNEFQPYQKFVQKSESASFITPATTSFEVFHPYKAEEPYLQQIYRDPVLSKIRNDLRDSKNRLQNYENEAGQTDVKGTEYLESLRETDRKKIPHQNIPTQFEMHRPHRRPIYYRPPFNHNHREHFLNNKLKSPWRTNVAKITPAHYRPIKHHLHGLRQQHAMKFDDERNEYPQVLPPEEIANAPDGYDIYEKGKEKYKQIKNNAEELVNKSENNTVVNPHLESVIRDTSGDDNDDNDDNDEYDEDGFVPIKNYAQVRKTESTRHLPKQAAFQDAESLEEIKNAPRLREAIKSTKAQTVYSEEGYEDGAYDHGGEEKHASDHEGHGGYLKEHEISGGKYKIPSIIGSHEDEKAAAYRDQILDNNKWEESKKQTDDEEESDDYSEHEEEHSDDEHTHDNNENAENERHKRDGETKFSNNNIIEKDNNPKNLTQQIVQDNKNKSHLNHDVIKRDTESDVSQTISHGDMALQENKSPQVDNNLFKYPYYNKDIKIINKNSPFRYAENIKLIPKKTEGGTEFYDSRSNVHCPEVESEVDPIPDKIKKGGHPDENEEAYSQGTGSKNINKIKKQRLSGLGDKIDCFKLKYFGENPLDSPFFEETKIDNPEPIILQNVTDIFFVLDKLHKKNPKTSKFSNIESNNNDTVMTQSIGLTKILSQAAPFHQKDFNQVFVSKNRKKRATPFVYEPYKIIKDSQIQDSKKTTTTGNVSPLIKQLQSSRIIDKVSSVQDKTQGDKSNSHSKLYKDISKEDRQNHSSDKIDSLPSFIDVSSDERRGEPRFEIKPLNHKTSYSPVESRRAMSAKDYETRKKGDRKDSSELHIHPRPVERNYFNVSQYLPQNMELQNLAASTTVKKVIRSTTLAPLLKHIEEIPHNHENNEKFNEYEDEDEDEDEDKDENVDVDEDEDEDEDENENDEENIDVKETITTTTTTTQKPVLRKRSRGTTSPRTEIDNVTESPKLKLITRFHSPKPVKITETKEDNEDLDDIRRDYMPKYTELKKKSRARTLVTDTQVYGDNDEDTRKLEVDKLIGVKQDMDDYLPLYEKTKTKSDDKNKVKIHHEADIHVDNSDVDNVRNDKDDDNEEIEEDDSDEDDDEDEDNEEDDDEGELENHEEDEGNIEESHKEHNGNKATPKYDGKTRFRLRITTPEPTKRTLLRTTVPPTTTTVAHRDEIKMKPIILKKIEIHNEIPVIGSSPNVTQFRQDIKEIEIVRKNPLKINRNINKNLEALDLYRDDNLAKDINSLGGVDIFRENLNLESEPKHGGNYRSIHDEIHQTTAQPVKPTEDVETSESEHKKLLKLEDKPLRIRSRQKGVKEQKGHEARSLKTIELSDSDDISSKSLRGGNLRLSQNRNSRRQNINSKYIELQDDDDVKEEIEPEMHGGNFRDFGSRHQTSRGRGLHGGNYRSARIVEADKKQIKTPKRTSSKKENTNKAAELLDTYVRAVPILTTTPAYILDPSKRMYYYVDA